MKVQIKYIKAAFALVILVACGGAQKSTVAIKGTKQDQLTESERADVTVVFFNANKEKIIGNYSNAASLFADVIRKDPTNAAAHYELSNIYMQQKNAVDALYFAKSAYKIDPSNPWYALSLMEVNQKNGKYDDAAFIGEQLVKSNPKNYDYYYEWAASLLLANKPSDAVKVYDQLQQLEGASKELTLSKFKIYQRISKNEKAEEELIVYLKDNPKDAQMLATLAEFYESIGQKEKALETLNRIGEFDPNNPFINLSLANYYRNNGDNDKSFEALKAAFTNRDLDVETKIGILSSYYVIIETNPEMITQALALSQLMIEAHPSEGRAFAVHGDFLSIDKKLIKAFQNYEQAVALGVNDYSVISQMLLLTADLKAWDTLTHISQKAIDDFPEQALPFYFNGIAHSQLKRFDKAIAPLNAAVKLVVDNNQLLSQIYALLGDAYQELKNFDLSDSSYDKALNIDSSNAYVMNNYAYYLSIRNEKLELAETLSLKSLTIEPNSASFQDTYGWILYKMTRYNEAKSWIEKALSGGDPQSGAVLEHYADVLFKLGNVEKALEYWQRAKIAGDGLSEFIDEKIKLKKVIE
ncbi:MAG: hypothetical protein RIQ89_1710 [Bacteroidota bacterium]|jgi:tetratricopeptide (TPR) repeat protein